MNNEPTEEKTIVLDYDLYSLPTTQHKAGLAGLLLMIESMRMRKMTPLPDVVKCTASSARISFTLESMQTLFNDLFDASWGEIEVKNQRKDKNKNPIESKRIVEKEIELKDGKKKIEKRYIYDQIQPAGKFLSSFYPDGDGLWLKLWRDMIWSTLRGRPKQRLVFQERADGKSSSESDKWWSKITKAQTATKKGKLTTENIASTVFVGAQDENAERVPFQGEVEQNFLLFFWPIAGLVFAPQRVKMEGELEDAGYVLVIPEPSDLTGLIQELVGKTGKTRGLLQSLETEASRYRPYRPKAALIYIPAEGGLEYLYHLTRERVAKKEIQYGLSAVEIFHLEKRGNNIRTLTAERILPDKHVLEDYDTIREHCHNPLYKGQRIKNLLAGNPWYDGMESLFAHYPWEFFVWAGSDTPRRFPFFGYDSNRRFRDVESELKDKGGKSMSEKDQDDFLARRVYRLIERYVNQSTEEKSGKKYEDFKSNKDDKGRIIYPKEYREARERVCSNAFLAIRGRNEKDFVEYFTGTICSVPQWLPEDEYIAVSQALMTEPEKVKVFSMLALSAKSYLAGSSDENGGKS
ncbi:type I-MYXAN CRISPR-associated protein Cmx8 [candidate division WOR-3 bacterium]|nr:type I-MYXAN CRISPR-associated protein Cmx8 [candidate division WOR-3 bacterium]